MYKRIVTFRDMDKNRWSICFELRDCNRTQKSRKTLQDIQAKYELSVTGDGGISCGQCWEYIVPRTENQRKLIALWKQYHLNHMSAGTKMQSQYLFGSQYIDDFNQFIDWSQHHQDHFELNDFYRDFKITDIQKPDVKKFIQKYMGNNPSKYMCKKDCCCIAAPNDFYVQCLFLAIRGLYDDRGYKYGTGWLYEELPLDIKQQIDSMCDLIEQEEKLLTQQLTPVFDMGDEIFQAGKDVVEQVMALRDCNLDEAKRFIALGIHLKCTFGDLNDTFKVSDTDLQIYSANGINYHIGTEYELNSIAEDIVHNDDEYRNLWIESVKSGETTESLSEWLDSLVENDGWVSILNHWNGKYDSYLVDNDLICISLT